MDLQLWLDKAQIKKDALSGQTVVITGGARGIGEALVQTFSQLGAAVVAVDIEEPAGPVCGSPNRRFIQGDVSIAEEVTVLAQEVHAGLGTPDILINNAALSPVSPLVESSVDLWDRVMAVNLRGAFLTCRAFLPGMLKRGRGTILNMVSAEAMPYMTAYIASKQGLSGLSQSLAAEVSESGVLIIAFGPGIVDTPGLNTAMGELSKLSGVDQKQMMEGALPAEQAAAAAACLVIKYAADYNGEMVDGYTILERAGLVEPAYPVLRQKPMGTERTATGRVDAGNSFAVQALSLSKDFQQVIFETGTEFNKLPVFVRPMAKNRFKAKSGQGLGEWEREVTALIALLGQVQAGSREDIQLYLELYSPLRARLDRFIDYCRAVPGETARFIKDPVALQNITRTMEQREELVCSLAAALEQVQVQLAAESNS